MMCPIVCVSSSAGSQQLPHPGPAGAILEPSIIALTGVSIGLAIHLHGRCYGKLPRKLWGLRQGCRQGLSAILGINVLILRLYRELGLS